MSELTCTYVRRSRFIDRNIVFNIKYDDHGMGHETSVQLRKEMTELGLAFFSNRVELRFTLERKDRRNDDWTKLRERVKEFCETKCTGYWSWKLRQRNLDSDAFGLEMDLLFENEADLELFLKEQALIIRLTY